MNAETNLHKDNGRLYFRDVFLLYDFGNFNAYSFFQGFGTKFALNLPYIDAYLFYIKNKFIMR